MGCCTCQNYCIIETETSSLYAFGHKEVFDNLKINKERIKSIKSLNLIKAYSPSVIITDSNDNYWCNGSNRLGWFGCDPPKNETKDGKDFIYHWQENDFFKKSNVSIDFISTSVNGGLAFWITKDGQAYATGHNPYGELGLNPKECDRNVRTPTLIQSLTNVIDIRGCEYSSIALCGFDKEKVTKIVSYWVRSGSETDTFAGDIVEIVCNYTVGGTVYRAGLWKKTDRDWEWDDPVPIEQFEEIESDEQFENGCVVSIACGKNFQCILNDKGVVFIFGNEVYIGDDSPPSYQYKPVIMSYFVENKIFITSISMGRDHVMALDKDSNVYRWGKFIRSRDPPKLIEELRGYNIVEIKAEDNYCYARSDNNLHWVWGYNNYYELKMEQNWYWVDSRCGSRIDKPFMINDLFYEKSGGKMIKDVYFGHKVMYVVGVDDDANDQ